MTENTILQLKLLLVKCLEAETNLARFLQYCAKKYGFLLTDEETAQGMKLMEQVSVMVDKLDSALNRPPDKLPVYVVRGWVP